MTSAATVAALSDIVGTAHVLTAAADQAPFLTDWRQRYTGAALAVVLPADTAQVAQVVRACVQAGVPIVPQGGNTGLVGGATPDASQRAVVVSLRRLNHVRAIDTDNDTLTAEAGCTLHAVQQAAQAAGRLFPLSLAAEGSATLGGNLATNAGGTQVLRYGNARDLTLGVEVVLPSGELLHGLRGLRKDNTGYDLRGLFVGGEGTLGIITAATVKLYPLPKATRTAIVALPSLAAATDLLRRARARADAALTAFEVMSVVCLDELARQLPQVRQPLPREAAWYALLEISDSESESHAQQQLEALLTEALDAGVASDAAIAQSLAESNAFWQVRESIPEAQVRAGGNVKHDIALPVSAIAGFVAATDAALKARFAWIKPVVFGHLGDGNLHYNMGVVDGAPTTLAFEHEPAINQLVHDAVAALGGSISAEHGIGQLKRAVLPQYKSAVELDLMRAIKAALDPRGLMNPGKLL
jgi:FAD/FMN-containing dehydrogenase